MRSFLAVSLAVMAGGCGDNVADGQDGPDRPTLDDVLDDGGAAAGKMVPELCSAREWSNPFIEDKNLALRAVPVTHGTAVLSVARTGGSLYGFVVDARGQIIGDVAGTKVISGDFSNLSATSQDGRLIAAVVDGSKVQVHVIKDDLSDTYLLDTVAGTSLIGDATVIRTRGQRVTVVGGADGVVTTAFDQQWAWTGSSVFAHDVPLTLSSTAYGEDAMVGWSTNNQCNVARISASHVATQDFSCMNNRIAANYADRSGQMVFEVGDAVHRADVIVGAHNELASNILLAPQARSPRIVFDGQRYWVSYINVHGDVTLGYLDENSALVSTPLNGIRPAADAYDLAVLDGAVWIYAVDGDNGYTSSKMCLVRR